MNPGHPVTFVDLQVHGDHYHEIPFAADPLKFFAQLKADGYQSLRLHYAPGENGELSDRMTTGFVGGGSRWLIEARKADGVDYWEARWDTGDEVEGSIWDVAYGRIVTGHQSAPPAPGQLIEAKTDLAEALRLIATFAHKHAHADFAKNFDDALLALSSDTPLKGAYYADMAPEGTLPLDALRLLAAAQSAWVFGGMGSWNDLGFIGIDQTEYVTLSDDLYDTLLVAITEAANASAV